MALPTQTDMFGIVLKYMGDGEKRSRKQVRDLAAERLGLTSDELAEATSSGVPVYESRVGWAISYLNRAKLLDRVSRGVYRINDAGRNMLATGIEGSEFFGKLRQLIDEQDPWRKGAASKKMQEKTEPVEAPVGEMQAEGESPQEVIANAVEQINDSLASELIEQVLNQEPGFFEKLVVDLLERMGYGTGKITRYVGDGGIDGIVTCDTLGFDPIYTQAKRYAPENTVSQPELQKFAGALGATTKGVFITTSSFTRGAIEFADRYPHATIVLIDGKRLAQLMIRFNVGVSTEFAFEVKRLDIDYFEND